MISFTFSTLAKSAGVAALSAALNLPFQNLNKSSSVADFHPANDVSEMAFLSQGLSESWPRLWKPLPLEAMWPEPPVPYDLSTEESDQMTMSAAFTNPYLRFPVMFSVVALVGGGIVGGVRAILKEFGRVTPAEIRAQKADEARSRWVVHEGGREDPPQKKF